jgi:hypothetical protein
MSHDDDVATLVAELRAQRDIGDVLRRYCTGVDRKDYELVRSAYHEDAYDDHGAYKGDVEGLIAWVRDRHSTIEQSMHFLGNSTIDVEGDRAFGETYCVVHQRRNGDAEVAPTRLTIGCRYLDRFERREGEWRLARHVVAYEWWREEPCDGERELGPEWTVSRRSRDDVLYRMRDEAVA